MANDNLVLEYLRAIRGDLSNIQDTLSEHGRRLTGIERGQANLLSHIAHLGAADAEQQGRYDRLTQRVERIERRLELADDA